MATTANLFPCSLARATSAALSWQIELVGDFLNIERACYVPEIAFNDDSNRCATSPVTSHESYVSESDEPARGFF